MKGMKTGGRKKGTPNKPTPMREKMQMFCEATYEEFIAAFHEIDEPKDKCKIWLEMQSYCTPKPASVDINVNEVKKTYLDDVADMLKET